MVTRKAMGRRGARGATGPAGRTGARGARGAAGADNRDIIKGFDNELHGIYRALSEHMAHLTRVQHQLDEMRRAIRKLGMSIKD
jgi:hypothetical protein